MASVRNESRGIPSRGQRARKKEEKGREGERRREEEEEEEEKVKKKKKKRWRARTREKEERTGDGDDAYTRVRAQNLILSSAFAHLAMASPFTVAKKRAGSPVATPSLRYRAFRRWMSRFSPLLPRRGPR